MCGRSPAPLIGSGRQDFEALYGAPKGQTGDGSQYEVSISGRPVLLTVKWGQGTDQRTRVSRAQRRSALARRTPGRRHRRYDLQCVPANRCRAGWGDEWVQDTPEYIYTSAALAQVFASQYFVDDSYKAVPSGTLNRLDQISQAGQTGVTSCTIAPGRH